MKAAHIMTRNVVSVKPDTMVLEAARLMLQHGISGLPVVDDNNHLVGIITEGDLLHREETGTQRQRSRWVQFFVGPGGIAEDYVRSRGRKVGDVMTRPVQTIGTDAPLIDVVELLERHRIKRLPVLRGDHTVIGIVSRANLLYALASLAPEINPTTADDDAIRENLLAHLHQESWAPVGMINIVVRNSIVELWGSIFDERKRRALVLAAENVRGVKAYAITLFMCGLMSGPSHQATRIGNTP